jgi:hypothetical protein
MAVVSNKFSMAHLAITILTTSLLVGGTMYSISSKLIMAEVRMELSAQADYFRNMIDLENSTLEVRVDNKMGYTISALDKLEAVVYDIEKSVITLQQQQITDIELRYLVGEFGEQLQLIRTDIALLNVRTASVTEITEKVNKLNSEVISLNEKVKKK